MKKNNMLRLASVLLVAVLLSTCAISGVFAKYQSVGPNATDSAQVADWGVVITGTGVMFNNSYLDEATTYTANEQLATITVQADTEGTKIVAPGTEGTLASIGVTGSPEVDVTVTYVATLTLNNWELEDDSFYCPITITVGDDDFCGLDYASPATFAADVKAAIEGKTAVYHTNTDLSVVNDDVQVSWAWAFEGATGSEVDQTIDNDTYLGDQAAADNAATIALTITTTIAQNN